MGLRYSMGKWRLRRRTRWRGSRTHSDLWIALAILAGLAGYQFHRYRPTQPLPAIIGTARVIDGDSIEIAGTRIRLQGIDAPELDQTCTDQKGSQWPCGRAATGELRAHIHGRALRCENLGLDRYRRVLAVCALPEGADINGWMVRQGWAVVSGFERTYAAEESEARSARRGLWVGSFVPPWEWRQQSH